MNLRTVHVFVAKLWLEQRELEGEAPEWRGRIDHVQSGKYAYFRNLAQAAAFIQSYLDGQVAFSRRGDEHEADEEP